jgi:RNA 2',3'-cyclic 3'-phosphodiesterase
MPRDRIGATSPQADLFGGMPQGPLHRLFFALMPDATAVDAIATTAASLQRTQGLRGNPIQRERYHATLHFLGDTRGDLPQSRVDEARRVADRVQADCCEVLLDSAVSFGRGGERPSPCVLKRAEAGVELAGLWKALHGLLRASSLSRELEHAFVPHVTWLYSRDLLAEQPITPIRWTAREFVLVHSIVQGDYAFLGRWPLC